MRPSHGGNGSCLSGGGKEGPAFVGQAAGREVSDFSGVGKTLDSGFEGGGETFYHLEGDVLFPAFDDADIVAVAWHEIRELLLGEALSETAFSDRFAKAFYAVGLLSLSHVKERNTTLPTRLPSRIGHLQFSCFCLLAH